MFLIFKIILVMNLKTSDLFVRCLENEGVEYIFALPGEENLDLIESIRKSKINLIVTRHEQAAGFMAATFGRLTGKAGVVLTTLGPGATNLTTPSAYAYLGGMPMLMITGQKPIKTSKQGHFQIVNTVDLMKPVTKFTKQIVNSSNVAALTREAFRIAEEERPGAVHLELPEDIAEEEIEGEPFSVEKIRRPVAEEKAIKKAVELIHKSKSPLILIGAGANRKITWKMLRQFVDEIGIPFFNTQMGKGVVDERHPLYIGTAALLEGDYIHKAIENTDLIINIGHDVIEKPPFIMKKGGAQVIHINFYSAKVDNVYFPQLEVVGDIGNAVWQLKELVKKQNHWDFSHVLEIKNEIERDIAAKSKDDSYPMHPQKIVSDIRKILPDDGIVALDNGMYKLWFARNYKAHEPNTLLLDNALATMGAGLASAIAVRILYPDRKILAVCGDGGFMMNSQELETAVRLNLDIIIIILRDNCYGMIKWKQDISKFPNFGLNFGNPDFVKYAESYGAKGHRAANANDFSTILKKCLNEKGIHIIDVPIDYSHSIRS